jgi:bifunctional DNA-binding transcriptional regulator/antitoxin component of YhaV-PrlF toxin-antitoxin module
LDRSQGHDGNINDAIVWRDAAFACNANSPYSLNIATLKDEAMTTLTVTARGQVTFRKDVLQHLGIKPGGKMELDLLPGGRGVLKAARPGGAIDGFVGLLAGRTTKVASIEEMSEAAAQAWAGKP